MKRGAIALLFFPALLCALLAGCRGQDGPSDEKPVLYLYPEEETEVAVSLELDGGLTCAYPAYDGGWTVTAAPDGTLTDRDGKTYNYLYWEGDSNGSYDFSQGFCIPGGDTAAFLEDALARLGLTRREANEFIVYWLPRAVEWGGAELPFLTRLWAERLIASRGAVSVAERETTLSLSYPPGSTAELFFSDGRTVSSAAVPLRTQRDRAAMEKALGSVTGRAVANWTAPDASRPIYGLRYPAGDGEYEAVYLGGVWLDNRGNALLADLDLPSIWEQFAREPAERRRSDLPCQRELALQNGQWNHWFMSPSAAENLSREVNMTLSHSGKALTWTLQNGSGTALNHGNGGGAALEVSLTNWWYTVPLRQTVTPEEHTLAEEALAGLPDGTYRLVLPLYVSARAPEEGAFFGYTAASFQLKNGVPLLPGETKSK